MKTASKITISPSALASRVSTLKFCTALWTLFILAACTQVTTEPERRCTAGLCGVLFSQKPISEEEKLQLRVNGIRVPLYNPPLIYPEFLFNQRIEGTVALIFDIDNDGNAFNIRVTCSEPNNAFNMYAIEFMERKKFEPSSSISKNQTQVLKYRLHKDTPKLTKCSKTDP